jgi:hypothetical protein
VSTTPKKAANDCHFCFPAMNGPYQIAVAFRSLVAVGCRFPMGRRELGCY